MNQQQMQEVINSIYPEDCTELVLSYNSAYKLHVGKLSGAPMFKRPEVSFYYTEDLMEIKISQPVFGMLLHMKFKPVEKCCAMCFLYHFSVGPNMSPELVKTLVDGFLANANGWMWFSSRRLIINMVEMRGGCSDPLVDVVPITTPRMYHRPLFDYFHQNAARVNTMLMSNPNTGNVIHHMEVLFDKDYFEGK